MAATDIFYRNQKTLNIVFAASSVAMLVAVIWMFADDFNRPYKKDQRTFRLVEEEMNRRALLALAPSDTDVKTMAASEAKVVKARAAVREARAKVDATTKSMMAAKAKLDTRLQNTKADYDAAISYFNIAVEKNDTALAERHKATADGLAPKMAELRHEIEDITAKIAAAAAEPVATSAGEMTLAKAESDLKELEVSHKSLTGEFDRFVKQTALKKWGWRDSLRSMPVLDGFASPVKIKQSFHDDLPIDYGGFKYVTRYDRCTTCHLGIDKANLTTEALTTLTSDPASDPKLQAECKNAQQVLALRQEQNPDRKQDVNLLKAHDLEPQRVPLSPAQIKEFAAHPRLDLFVGAGSPHSAEKFGCTICHSGQGSATGFIDAVHTPNDIGTMAEWKKSHNWQSIHFWDFPMLPARFVESSCIKCHHQVESLVRDGAKNEAPKVVKGYNLVRELGCFGCHEISGVKNGRWVGPDLRLESDPPLESLSPLEREKRLSDPANPPGMQRKVGPSLARLAEKVDAEWATRWLKAPRAFRPDTKMPHFYDQANNTKEVLPEDQKAFPDAEARAISHYLFSKSGQYIAANPSKGKKDGDLPKPPADEAGTKAQLEQGRHLFAVKGCMACHKHAGMETNLEGGPPSLEGESYFGPELSRVAAKLDPQKARGWLINWLLDPTKHSPRTLMPSTHLTDNEAADIAAWLLSQTADPGDEWKGVVVDRPATATLQEMTRMYLRKAGLTTAEVNRVVASGFSTKEIDERYKAADADERELMVEDGKKLSDDHMLNFIGKKAIGNLGCYACHTIPGFDNAKPIGVALNDWGKKDVDRIAFEDADNFVQRHYQLIDSWSDKPEASGSANKDAGHGHATEAPGRPLEKYAPYPVSDHTPYERYFADMLGHGHRQREGFLHLKLMSPRAYDYGRVKEWNDRARMPQFKFARVARLADEKVGPEPAKDASDDDKAKWKADKAEKDAKYAARVSREEADAREAVMTFVLGLIAEPIPEKYVYQGAGDRLAEVKGQQVIEKFNCASCHLFRPGEYHLKLGDKKFPNPAADNAEQTVLEMLIAAHKGAVANEAGDPKDHVFSEHAAWSAKPAAPGAAKVVVRGEVSAMTPEVSLVRPSEAIAFRYTDAETKKEVVGVIPAHASGANIIWWPEVMREAAPPMGGRFALLLKKYLTEQNAKVYGDPQPLTNYNDEGGQALNGYAALPPALFWEGERVQPEWLYQFLLNPTQIRQVAVAQYKTPGQEKETPVYLRMPKFNLSPQEAQALVNYFGGVNRSHNAGTGLTYPYAKIPQRDEGYLLEKTHEYVARLSDEQKKARIEELKPVWKQALGEQLTTAKRRLQDAEAVKDQPKVDEAKKDIANLEQKIGKVDKNDFQEQEANWREREAYVADAWKLVTYTGNLCYTCHQVGPAKPNEYRGPNLDLAWDRLRPEWTERWIAYPQRLTPYASLMPPQYKPSDVKKHAEEAKAFIGSADQQIQASRDLLMMYPMISDWPIIKYRTGLAAPPGTAATPAAK